MRKANRLMDEASPYLRQHAHNPVDWYPWGEEAFARARAEDKPILLSIGYSACHWCHVMERESFEDEETARLMNEHFVSVKVDREERPDVDHIYMSAVQMLIGRGGWPLTAFLTPEGKPFYGGTYFPPEDRHGLPGFKRLLGAVAEAYRDKPEDVQRSVEQIMRGLERSESFEPARALPEETLVLESARRLAGAYDEQHGGFGGAPKFPNASVLELFLRAYQATGENRFLQMVLHTLRQMARGGIYDQLGGGFHRYAVDAKWLVPHFEKMLYDNAQLVPLYLAAYQITTDLFYATVARETLDYVVREMRDPRGGFYSTQDADSEGEEGRYYVWDETEVRSILGPETADIVCRYWDVTREGNFEGRNILHVTLEIEQLARMFHRDPGELRLLLGEARARLFAARNRRVAPARDENVLTAWNGLMISAFARAAEVFGEAADRETALAAVAFVRQHLVRGDRLLSTWKDGVARLNGHLDDYAFYVAALIDVFEAVQERPYLDEAVRLHDSMIAHFWDHSAGGFFFTSDDHERLIFRTKPSFDGSIPAGNSVAVRNCLRLHRYTGREDYRDKADGALRLFARGMTQQPFAFAHLLCGLDFAARPPVEIVIVTEPEAEGGRLMAEQIRRLYLPNRTLLVVRPNEAGTALPPARGKTGGAGGPAAWVCRGMTCYPPAHSWSELEPLLRSEAAVVAETPS